MEIFLATSGGMIYEKQNTIPLPAASALMLNAVSTMATSPMINAPVNALTLGKLLTLEQQHIAAVDGIVPKLQ